MTVSPTARRGAFSAYERYTTADMQRVVRCTPSTLPPTPFDHSALPPLYCSPMQLPPVRQCMVKTHAVYQSRLCFHTHTDSTRHGAALPGCEASESSLSWTCPRTRAPGALGCLRSVLRDSQCHGSSMIF